MQNSTDIRARTLTTTNRKKDRHKYTGKQGFPREFAPTHLGNGSMDSSSSSLVLHSSFQYTDFSFHLLKGKILDQRWEVDTKLFSPKMVLRFLLTGILVSFPPPHFRPNTSCSSFKIQKSSLFGIMDGHRPSSVDF